MKVEVKIKPKKVELGTLSAGDTFMDERGDLFLLSNEIDGIGASEGRRAVCLSSGSIISFSDDYIVEPIKLKVVIDE